MVIVFSFPARWGQAHWMWTDVYSRHCGCVICHCLDLWDGWSHSKLVFVVFPSQESSAFVTYTSCIAWSLCTVCAKRPGPDSSPHGKLPVPSTLCSWCLSQEYGDNSGMKWGIYFSHFWSTKKSSHFGSSFFRLHEHNVMLKWLCQRCCAQAWHTDQSWGTI